MGPAIATEIILKSELRIRFELFHVNTTANDTIKGFGKWNFTKIFKNITIYFNMLRVTLKERPDLILIPISQTTTGFIKDSFFILIAKVCRRKVILQLRGSNFQNWIAGASFYVKKYVRLVLRSTQGIIVLGNNLKYLFNEYYSKEKIFVVPNGANYNFPGKEKDSKEIKILYLSNLLDSKGIEDVFKSIEILNRNLSNQEIPKFSLDLIGEWLKEDTKKTCLELKEKYKLPVRIHSSEASKDKLNYLTNADIFLFPPREPEGHPWCIVEAMAAGLPIISTNQGAISESVIDGVNGFVVEPKKPEMIAEKLLKLMQEKQVREKMGKASRDLYLQNFTEEIMVEKLSEVFKTVIENK